MQGAFIHGRHRKLFLNSLDPHLRGDDDGESGIARCVNIFHVGRLFLKNWFQDYVSF